MLNISSSTKIFICSQLINMHYSFDSLAGLVTNHFGMSPLSGHIFVFFSKRKDRMKLLFWELDGFALFYKRLDRGTYSWVLDLALDESGEIESSDFSMILSGINPVPEKLSKARIKSKKTIKKSSEKSSEKSATKPLQLAPLMAALMV